MVDVTSLNTDGIGQTAAAGINTGFIWITIGLIIAGVIALILWTRYLKSFNHIVVIKRPIDNAGGFEFDMGLKGRYVFKNSNNNDEQMVFQIFQAKKNKLNYTEGPVERHMRIPCIVKGKRQYMIIFSPDKAGFLHPIKLNSTEIGMLESQISQGAISFAAKAVDNITQKYRKQDFLQKYGLLIFIVLILIIAALYWWGSKSNSEAIQSVAQAVASQQQTQADLSNLIKGLINGSVQMHTPPTTTVIT